MREEYKVKAASNVISTSIAIAEKVKEDGTDLCVLAIGGQAVNQAVKSLIRAKGILAQAGVNVYFDMGFETIQKDRELSVVVFRVIRI